ncbi:MAG: hypothetical protein COA44_15820 [Arcobacter sp.]|nr:MAG: hypothetical protein COA44_15820 [Arcobacter sp.]
MTRLELLYLIQTRKNKINISLDNIAKLSHLGLRTVNRFFAGEDVKLSTVEKITNLLGLDFAGNEVISQEILEQKRAHEKALFLASIIQGTSALEMQGLSDGPLKKIIQKLENDLLHGPYKNTLWIA